MTQAARAIPAITGNHDSRHHGIRNHERYDHERRSPNTTTTAAHSTDNATTSPTRTTVRATTRTATIAPTTATPTDVVSPDLIGSIVSVGSLAFIGILTETVMNVLFPQLMGMLHVNASTIQWLTTGYLLVVSATVPASTYLNGRFQQKHTFVTANLVSIAGCVVTILASSFPMLLAARVLQGVGAGLALPLMFNIILERAPKSRIGSLMGLGTLVVGTAPALGPAFGGFVSAHAPWQTIFVAVIPVLVVSLVIGVISIEQPHATAARPFAFGQFLCVAAGFTGLIVGINQGAEAVSALSRPSGNTPATAMMPVLLAVAGAVVGIGGLIVFGVLAKRSADPLLHLGVLRNGGFRAHLFAYMMYQGVTIGFGYLIPNIPQMSMGTSMLTAGLLILPGSLIGAMFSPVGGMLLDRFGARRPILGATVAALAVLIGLVVLGDRMTPMLLAGLYVVYMFGFSLCYANIMTSGLSMIDADRRADGNAMFSTLQQFAGAAGTTVVATIVSVFQSGAGAAGSTTYRLATQSGARLDYLVMAVIVAVIGLLMTRALRKDA
ncbi:MFS transporter [Bifidobacterium callimiconis]|uniref:Major facilitator transporter n=1 Tax=Bifidobacterium callimiconis TaxID=2306973 RepID=A0A430F9L3_9BIFI|nr:MFS transporter [Bifidobacterium callimiconis]MBT1175973.1 MFS transporter [Bifidobacterium callimiconis]RSX49524.1 major facilitator transporter [Bifidobacterium callimiconis]